MTKFADQLLTDLMDEYRPALERIQPPPHRPRPLARRRPVWLATGAAGLAGAAAASLALLGGAAPAYAVTSHPNGTVTVALSRLDGIPGANAKLHALGDHVVVVPVRPGCPPMSSLQHPSTPPPGRHQTTATRSSDGSVTVNVQGIPAGDTAVVAAASLPHGGTMMAVGLTTGPVPSCVSLPAPPAGSGPAKVGRGGGQSVAPARSGAGQAGTSAQH